MSKKYYWLKLQEDFFDDDTISYIEEHENGIKYVNFYLKLCLKSLRNDGKLIRLVGETLIPYDFKALSKLTGTDIDTVNSAMMLFQNIGLVKILETGEIYMAQISEMVGCETDKAKMMRRLRANNNGNIVTAIEENCYTENRDKRIEIEKEIETLSKDNVCCISSEIQRVVDAWNTLSSFGINPIRGVKPNSTRDIQLRGRINAYSVDEILEAIEKIKESSFLCGDNKRNWVATFDWFIKPSNFAKVLEGNYKDKTADRDNTVNEKTTPKYTRDGYLLQ